MTNIAFALQDTDGNFYAAHGLDVVASVSEAMRFETAADADRVQANLVTRFIHPFEIVTLTSEAIGSHGALRWRKSACEQCERFDAEFPDPTFDPTQALPGTKPLRVCSACWKSNVDAEMMRRNVVLM